MRKFTHIISTTILLICATSLSAQVAINNDGSSANNSAVLDIKSTNRGLLLPRLTISQRDAISSPATGLIIYNSDEQTIQVFSGVKWEYLQEEDCSPDQTSNITGSQFLDENTNGEAYSITATTGATSYVWSVPTGASIVSGQETTSITVNFGTESGNISVYASNGCGNSTTTILFVEVFGCGEAFTDTRDGSTYNTVFINNQCWLSENLNIGSMIVGSTNPDNNGNIEKWCFNNLQSNCDEYGGLYSWHEMMQYVSTEGTQGICPEGWHIPTNVEWTALTDYAGGLTVSGGKLKETGTTHWHSPNLGATDEYGFTNLPGGYRNSDGSHNNLTYFSYTWSSTAQNTDNALSIRMAFDAVSVNNWAYSKEWGFSVRCIRD